MGLFRRTPKGRHALGAAVTSIPSGPLRVAAPPPAPAPPQPAAPEEPTVLASIAELIASGQAWVSGSDDVCALPTPVAAPSTTPKPSPVPDQPSPLPPPVLQRPVAVPEVQKAAPSARSSLEAALAELLPEQSQNVPVSVPAPSVPRVQLGFRDGTSASLDPESEQALALELLAQTLTRRD